MKQSQFYYLLRRGLFSAGSAIIKNGLVMFNKFTTAGLNFPTQGSAEFNGSSDFISIPSDSSISGITEDFTICFWGNLKSGKLNISKGLADATEEFRLQIWDSRIYFDVGNGSGPYIYPLVTTAFNEWNHFGLTSKRTSGTTGLGLYKNGSKITATTNGATNSHNTNDAPVFIGRFNTEYTEGNLANVAIWNRALSSDEINSVMWKSYQALSATESNGLQAWYSLDDITSPAASLANMEQLAADKDATIENKAAITAAINSLS